MLRLVAGVVVCLAACGGGGAGKVACDGGAYPCGPYGLTVGSTIANLTLVAQRDSDANGTSADNPASSITLSDYRQDSLAALAIIIASQSCVPCQKEQPDLKTLFASWHGKAAVLEAIVEDSTGNPASQAVVENWRTTFDVPFDMTTDPTGALSPYYPKGSYPVAIALRLADMKILYLAVGPAKDGLVATIDPLVGLP